MYTGRPGGPGTVPAGLRCWDQGMPPLMRLVVRSMISVLWNTDALLRRVAGASSACDEGCVTCCGMDTEVGDAAADV